MTGINRRQTLAAIASASLVCASGARAQDYPSKPLRIVVSYAAGGSTDAVARMVATSLSETLKQPVMVDNRPGGNSALGVNFTASQPADGYSLMVVDPSQFVVNPNVYKKLPYDATGFEPVAMLHRYTFMLVVRPDHPAKTLQEFVAYVKSRPNGINYASAGAGTPLHLGMEMMASATGIQVLHVPYKGVAPAYADLLGGQVEAMFADVGGAIQHLKAGKLRALAISSPSRHAQFPDVPTFAESGYPALQQVGGWFGIVVKRGTPAPIVQKLNAAVIAAIADPRVREWMHSVGATPAPLPNAPQEFARVMQTDYQMWGKVARDLNVSLD